MIKFRKIKKKLKFNIFKEFIEKSFVIKHAFELCKLGSKSNKYKFFLLIILILITGFTETLPVLMIIPFITIISDPEKALLLPKIKIFYNFFGMNEPTQLLLPFLILFILFVLLNAYLRIYIIDFIFFVKASIAHTLSKLAFEKVLFSTYEYQIGTNSSSIINDFNNSITCSISYIETVLSMTRDIVLLCFISIALFIVNAKLTAFLFLIAFITYIISFTKKNKLLSKEGRVVKITSESQLKVIQESLGSIKNIILENNQNLFLNKYSYFNKKYLSSEANISAALTKPKYVIEGIFISIIGIAAYIFKVNLGLNPIPTLGGLVLGFQKLLPIVNNLFINYSSMLARYEQSCKTLNLIEKTPQDLNNLNNLLIKDFVFRKLELKNICYSYPFTKQNVIKDCNLTISKGETIGIKGKTGVGKSTLINLIMALIKPSSGTIKINNINIINPQNEINLINWRRSIAHVPQFIYLSDTSIIENIAFGEKINDIDFEKAIFCAKAAKIYEYIENSDKGFYTKIGERGIKLSGGQLQRIGIARALYRESEILILDEATSALDQITEKEVVDSIRENKKELTIISISHRLSTLIGYDKIIRFENKKIYFD